MEAQTSREMKEFCASAQRRSWAGQSSVQQEQLNKRAKKCKERDLLNSFKVTDSSLEKLFEG